MRVTNGPVPFLNHPKHLGAKHILADPYDMYNKRHHLWVILGEALQHQHPLRRQYHLRLPPPIVFQTRGDPRFGSIQDVLGRSHQPLAHSCIRVHRIDNSTLVATALSLIPGTYNVVMLQLSDDAR
jgi:hypothetical protein